MIPQGLTKAWRVPMDSSQSRVIMAKLIKCECGYVAHGDGNEQVVSTIEAHVTTDHPALLAQGPRPPRRRHPPSCLRSTPLGTCLLYTSDAADEEDSVDLGG